VLFAHQLISLEPYPNLPKRKHISMADMGSLYSS